MLHKYLSDFDKLLARFGDRVSLIASLEVGGKLTAEEAYQEIKVLWKELKKYRKETKNNE